MTSDHTRQDDQPTAEERKLLVDDDHAEPRPYDTDTRQEVEEA